MGFRHVAHLRALGLTDIAVADPDPSRRRAARAAYGVATWASLDEGLAARPGVVLVCTPAGSHLSLARQAVEAGAHIFVEKPLSMATDGIDDLTARATQAGRIVQVGYNLRYHPAFKAMKRLVDGGALGRVLTGHAEFGLYLGKWWPRRDYRQSYMADAADSGGLVFDVSHEMDILAWFLGAASEVMAYGDKLSTLEIGGVDVVKAVLRMRSGAIASLHIDCLQPTYTRVLSLVGEDAALRWDCPRGRLDRSLGRLRVYDAKRKRYEPVKLEGRAEETYVEELRDFLRCVATGTAPLVGLAEGRAALDLALAIQMSIATAAAVRVGAC
jgi:predicted dehydrogenase